MVSAQLVVLVLGFAGTGLSIDGFSIMLLALPVVVCAAIAILYRNRHDAPRIAIAAETVAILAATLAIGELITYAAGAAGFPSVEQYLFAIDRALGFEWLDYARWVDSMPWFVALLSYAYDSFNVQFVAIVALLVASAKIERLQVFLLAVFVALALTCFLFTLAPAATAFHMVGDATDAFDYLYPVATEGHAGTLLKIDQSLAHLRDGTLQQIAAQDLVGLIAFPSFHTCAAVLFIWASWDVRPLRLPMAILNMAMVAATPVYGGHYLADALGGAALTVVSIPVSRRIIAWARSGTRIVYSPPAPAPRVG